jgi:hypothetical protein
MVLDRDVSDIREDCLHFPGQLPPIIKDSTSNEVSSGMVGQLVVISSTLFNPCDYELPYVIVIEVRDESGITNYLNYAIDAARPVPIRNIMCR